MSGRQHRWVLLLFPRTWRDRYAEEFLALLEAEGLTLAAVADIAKTAALERITNLFTKRRRAMAAGPPNPIALSTKPSAILPVLMSLAALALVGTYLLINGVKRQADEGATAHIFQILVVAQIPVIGFFVLRWIRSNPLTCLIMLGIQALALAAALFPVWYFHL